MVEFKVVFSMIRMQKYTNVAIYNTAIYKHFPERYL